VVDFLTSLVNELNKKQNKTKRKPFFDKFEFPSPDAI
jgi:hypothetical protein